MPDTYANLLLFPTKTLILFFPSLSAAVWEQSTVVHWPGHGTLFNGLACWISRPELVARCLDLKEEGGICMQWVGGGTRV